MEAEIQDRLGQAERALNALSDEAEAEGFELEVQIVENCYRLFLVRRIGAPAAPAPDLGIVED